LAHRGDGKELMLLTSYIFEIQSNEVSEPDGTKKAEFVSVAAALISDQ
jgi:hypothetical protein